MKNKLKLIIPVLLVIIVTLVIVLIPKNKDLEKEDNIYNNLDFGDTNIIFNSNEVNYDNSESELQSRTVQDVIDELYDSINNGCAGGYAKGEESGGTYTCNKRSSDALSVTVFDSGDVNYDNSNSGLTSENVEDAINELKEAIPDCKDGYTKTNNTSNSYDCKKTVTITANNQTITYGDSITQNINQVTVTGLVTGDSLTGITLTPSTTNVPGGTITPSSAVIERNSTNVTSTYNINYVQGTLTINKASGYVTISASSGSVDCEGTATFTVSSHHGGTLSCTSDDTSKATCSVSDTTVTVNGVGVGNTTLTITSAATTNYNAASITYTATISYPLAATYISSLLTETTPYGKVYTGTNPDNYVWFNNEQWRIIGVYTDEVNGDMLKIIKATPYTTNQEYSSSTNAWSGSSMQTYLYNNYNSIISDTTSREMVFESGKWNVGAAAYNANASEAYNSAIGTTWTGKIGLIASYEYMYGASNDGCWTTSGPDYRKGCYQKDWLFSTVTNSGSSNAWTLSPRSDSSYTALLVSRSGYVSDYAVASRNAASPVVYLKSTIKITGGNGQSGSTNSYKLE